MEQIRCLLEREPSSSSLAARNCQWLTDEAKSCRTECKGRWDAGRIGENGESWPIWRILPGTQEWDGEICRVGSGCPRYQETDQENLKP